MKIQSKTLFSVVFVVGFLIGQSPKAMEGAVEPPHEKTETHHMIDALGARMREGRINLDSKRTETLEPSMVQGLKPHNVGPDLPSYTGKVIKGGKKPSDVKAYEARVKETSNYGGYRAKYNRALKALPRR